MNLESLLEQLLARITQLRTSEYALPVAMLLAILIILIVINWRSIRVSWLERRTRYSLNHIGIRQMKQVICSDGLDGSFKIDRLAMLHDSILLVSFKPYSGNIYCADSIPEWTQIIDQKSYKFVNPIFELDNQVNTIQGLVPSVRVRGVVFFDHSAKFPKGHPNKVMTPADIPDYMIRSKSPEPSSEILDAWETLLKLPAQARRMGLAQ